MSNLPISIASVKQAATELNEVLGLNPKINTKLELPKLLPLVKEAITIIEEGDEFTPETQEVIDTLLKESEKVPVAAAKQSKNAKPAPKPEPEELEAEPAEEQEEPAEDDSLEAQINNAATAKDLKTIAKANDEFKAIRGELASYVDFDELAEAMLNCLKPVAPAAPKKAKEEKQAAAKPEKKEKAAEGVKKSEKFTYSRVDAVCDALKKNPKTVEEWAEATNKECMKHGGRDNLKESKNLIKQIHRVFINLGIDIPKVKN